MAANGLHWRSTREFVADLTSANDKLICKVEATDQAQSKTVKPRTKPAILMMMKLQRPAPYFANALLCAGFPNMCLFVVKISFRSRGCFVYFFQMKMLGPYNHQDYKYY